jgi:hypothetical protein
MICEPCKRNDHRHCIEGGCDCPRRKEDQQIERSLTATRQSDEGLAEMVYSALLYGGSDVTRMLTDGAGKEAVRLFVEQVLRTFKAVRC